MDPSNLISMFLLMQLLPSLMGGGGADIASGNVVLLPVAVGQMDVHVEGQCKLPFGVEKDRRRNGGGDRRNGPPGRGRRATDFHDTPPVFYAMPVGPPPGVLY